MTQPATSAIPAAQDGLHKALHARPRLADVTLELGEPKDVKRTHIWISGSVRDWTQKWAVTGPTTGAGRAAREETFQIPIEIFVVEGKYAAARDLAFRILAEVEEALREDFDLGDVVFDAGFIGGDAAHARTDDGHAIGIAGRVAIVAQIG